MSTTSKAPNTSRWALVKYVDEIYLPARYRLPKRTAESYRNQCRHFAKWAGDDVKLREITPELLEKYEQHSRSQGCKPRTAQDRTYIVRAVLRHWRPDDERWSKRPTGDGPKMFLEVDVNGSLEQFFQDRYLVENVKITSKNTIRCYGHAFKAFSLFLGRPAMLADLTDETVGRFMRHRSQVDHAKERTINGEVAKLKAIWNWAAKKRIVALAPTIADLPEPEIIPRAWTKAELASLFSYCRRVRGWINSVDVLASAYWTAWHLVQWDTGERTGAMLDLRWSMLEAATGHMCVPAEVRKARDKAMVYKLKPPTLEALEAIREPTRDLIFGPMERSTFYHRYRKLIEGAGLEYTRKCGPQKMRRTFASFIIAAGGDATAALKHADRRTTEESYTDPTIARPLPANELLFDL